MENKIINDDNDINKELYKTNESFSDELILLNNYLDIINNNLNVKKMLFDIRYLFCKRY